MELSQQESESLQRETDFKAFFDKASRLIIRGLSNESDVLGSFMRMNTSD